MPDSSLIPSGGFCYRVEEIRDGEVLSDDIERFGKDLREFRYHGNHKEVLCPYWQRTDYGTVRCTYLGREVVDEDDPAAKGKWMARFGEARPNFQGIGYSWALPDEIKICAVREFDEDK